MLNGYTGYRTTVFSFYKVVDSILIVSKIHTKLL